MLRESVAMLRGTLRHLESLCVGSPDLADALALTFALPVAKKVPEDIYIKRRNETTQKAEYDPYSKL